MDCNYKKMKFIALFFLFIYKKFISPNLPQSCRFYPSCSVYSKQAFSKYGVSAGLWLTVKRVLKCQPFHPGGFDPLP